MLRACVTPRVTVVVSEIPGRPRLDGFTAPDATHAASSDERGQGAAESAMLRPVHTGTEARASIRLHRERSPPSARISDYPHPIGGDGKGWGSPYSEIWLKRAIRGMQDSSLRPMHRNPVLLLKDCQEAHSPRWGFCFQGPWVGGIVVDAMWFGGRAARQRPPSPPEDTAKTMPTFAPYEWRGSRARVSVPPQADWVATPASLTARCGFQIEV